MFSKNYHSHFKSALIPLSKSINSKLETEREKIQGEKKQKTKGYPTAKGSLSRRFSNVETYLGIKVRELFKSLSRFMLK